MRVCNGAKSRVVYTCVYKVGAVCRFMKLQRGSEMAAASWLRLLKVQQATVTIPQSQSCLPCGAS
jgi:hypothetical protein